MDLMEKGVERPLPTPPLWDRIINYLKRNKKTIFISILAVIAFTILAIWWMLKPLEKKPKSSSYAIEAAHQLSVIPLLQADVEKALKMAKEAKKTAEQAKERERELAKQLALLQEPGLETEKAQESSFLPAFLRNFLSSNEHDDEAEPEIQTEKDLEKIYEKLGELEHSYEVLREHAYAMEHRHQALEEDVAFVAETLNTIEEGLEQDFAIVESQINTIDEALLNSLKHHQEEREKINELTEELQTVGESVNVNTREITKLDSLEERIKAGENHLDHLRVQLEDGQVRINGLEQQYEVIKEQMLNESARITSLEASLDRKIAELSDSMNKNNSLFNKKLQDVKVELNRLRESVSEDLRILYQRCSESVRASPEVERLEYEVYNLQSTIDDLNARIDTTMEMEREDDNTFDNTKASPTITVENMKTPSEEESVYDYEREKQRELEERQEREEQEAIASEFNKVKRRLEALEDARLYALKRIEREREERIQKEYLEKRMLNQEQMYDMEAGDRRVRQIKREVDEIRRPLLERQQEEMWERIMAPANKVMADLREKYKDAEVVEAKQNWFELW